MTQLGILKSGAKLLGLTPSSKVTADSGKSLGSIIKILPFSVKEPSDQVGEYIVAVTPSSLTLWSNWNELGKEKQHWECSLSIMLEEDVSYMLGQFVGRVFILDACIMPITSDEGSPDVNIGIMLLSACRVPPSYEPNGHDTYNIFLHYIEFDLSSSPSATTKRAVLAVGIDDFREFPVEIQPRLHIHNNLDSRSGGFGFDNSTSLFVASWVAQGTLRICQVDISCLDFIHTLNKTFCRS